MVEQQICTNYAYLDAILLFQCSLQILFLGIYIYLWVLQGNLSKKYLYNHNIIFLMFLVIHLHNLVKKHLIKFMYLFS